MHPWKKMRRLAYRYLICSIAALALLAAGCARLAGDPAGIKGPVPGSGSHPLELEVGGLDRTYLLFVPGCYDGGSDLPLVLMFHGGGGSAAAVSRDTGWSDRGEESCFLVVYPEGLPEDRDRRASFSSNPRLWNDGSGRFNQDVDDIQFIQALLDSLRAELRIDDRRIFAAGFSNGASMAYRVAIELDREIAAIAPVAGSLWIEDFILEDPVSLIYITGTEDPLNPFEGGVPELARGESQPGGGKAKPPVQDQIDSWIKILECDLSPAAIPAPDGVNALRYSSCREGTEVQFYTIEGGGHHWPGGKIRLPEIYLGEKIDLLDGAELIWDFFQAHPKP